jgi:hypothetical protein
MGQYLARDVYVDDSGGLWVYGRSGQPALGGFWDPGGGWEQITKIALPITGGIATWLENKNKNTAGSGGSSGTIDPATAAYYAEMERKRKEEEGRIIRGVSNTTLMIGAIGVLLLMMPRPGGKH